MSQGEQIKYVMTKLQNYAKIPNGIITAEAVEKAFRNYGFSPNMIGQTINEQSRVEIINMLFRKMDERKCTTSLGAGFQEDWNFFDTNYSKYEQAPQFEWKVYIPIKPEHYGFVVKNIIAFLCDNGIISSGKISGTIRSDSMIVNLQNPENVTSLNEYLDRNPSLKSCLGNHQPSIPDWNGIGVIHGHDSKTSYTGRLSAYLTHYINVCKQQNRFDLITAEAFLESMRNALDNGLVQRPNEIQQIIEHMDIIINGKDYVQHNEEGKTHNTL